MPNFASCADEFVEHPTQKPADLMVDLLTDRKWSCVLDFFMGSGSADLAFDATFLPKGWQEGLAWAHFGGISLVREPLGAKLEGRVVIIDDVISAGTSVRESVQMIRDHGAIAVHVGGGVIRRTELPTTASRSLLARASEPILRILSLAPRRVQEGVRGVARAALSRLSALRAGGKWCDWVQVSFGGDDPDLAHITTSTGRD
jgi:hypothetical protein